MGPGRPLTAFFGRAFVRSRCTRLPFHVGPPRLARNRTAERPILGRSSTDSGTVTRDINNVACGSNALGGDAVEEERWATWGPRSQLYVFLNYVGNHFGLCWFTFDHVGQLWANLGGFGSNLGYFGGTSGNFGPLLATWGTTMGRHQESCPGKVIMTPAGVIMTFRF